MLAAYREGCSCQSTNISLSVPPPGAHTWCFPSCLINNGIEDAFPMRDVYQLRQHQQRWQIAFRHTYRHFSCVLTLSSIIRPMKATSPPAVINSFSAAVDACTRHRWGPVSRESRMAYRVSRESFQFRGSSHLFCRRVEWRVAEGKGEWGIATKRLSFSRTRNMRHVPCF